MPGDTHSNLTAGQKAGAGRFTLIRELGRGGMGVVWLARDDALNENAALKFLPADVAADAVALDDLRRETQKSRLLAHPNIIRIHDLYRAAGELPFISMEFVDGSNLTNLRLEQPQRCFAWAYLRPLVMQLCAALEYAHSEGVIHRDLKPANLMLGARGRLKLADFGIAATISDSQSRISQRFISSGTLAYMSPQQMDGESPRVTDDIYSLGSTLYELLSGRPPFYSGDVPHQVRNLMPKPLTEPVPEEGAAIEIPEPVKATVMACLSKDPGQRPQSAQELVLRLDDSAAIAPAPVAPEISSYSPEAPPLDDHPPANQKSSRKTMAMVMAGLAILLLAGLALFWSKFSMKKIDSAQNGPTNGFIVTNLPSSGAAANSELYVDAVPVQAELFTNGVSMGHPNYPVLLKGVAGESISVEARLEGHSNASRFFFFPAAGSFAHQKIELQSAQAKPATDTEEGFVSLFNGHDLTGWDGDPQFWSVENGCITGETTAQKIPNGNTFLVLKARRPDNFELRVKCQMTTGNSGVQFRSALPQRWKVTGYQQEIDAAGTRWWSNSFGALTTEPSPLLASCGDKVTYEADGRKVFASGAVSSFQQVEAGFSPQGWNEYTIIAQGDHVVLKINGLTTVDFTDQRPNRSLMGVIALQIHRNQGAPMKVLFKDIRLKMLKDRSQSMTTPTEISPTANRPWTNTLGMQFVSVPGTRILFSIWDTRVQDFEAFVNDTGYDATEKVYSIKRDGWKQRGDNWKSTGFTQGPTHPVVAINWDDANAFCDWLTKHEQSEGRLPAEKRYRLPKDAEWSAAAGTNLYPWGNKWPPPPGTVNYAGKEAANGDWPADTATLPDFQDDYARTSPVGSFKPNQFGLYDMGGNVWQWCEDWYRREMNSAEIRQQVPNLDQDGGGQKYHVLRGAAWDDVLPAYFLSACRLTRAASARGVGNGFRCVLADSSTP